MAAQSPLTNVSDTARWVAIYRARESARPDAIFKDPLAERLGGERGRAIVAAVPRKLRSGWSIIARTKLIDDLVLSSIADGCDCVVNVAAGLDTRPYRLALPPALRWVEGDLPAIIEEKERVLAGERPACSLRREAVDLADAGARAAFLTRATAGATKPLVITEGLLGYLNAPVVEGLARDLVTHAHAHHWILDLFSPGALAMLKGTRGHLAAPLLNFAPPEGVGFFEPFGWTAREVQSITRAAVRLHRAPLGVRLLALFPDPDPRKPGNARWFGVVRLARR